MIRTATVKDLPGLLELENLSFPIDRLSRRNFHHLLTRAHATTLVDETAGALAGYVAVLFHRGTSLARVYSLAVHPKSRGKGKSKALLAAAEQAARDRRNAYMRLEVHPRNKTARQLYQAAGYREFETIRDYYEDHADAIRMEKSLAPGLDPNLARVPYYEQSLNFTCGPAALLMAMHALDHTVEPDETEELRLWRESTTIYMTSGHGGCSPYGMALAAARRGFPVEVYVSGDGIGLFTDSVRDKQKKRIIRLVQTDFVAQLKTLDIPMHRKALRVEGVRQGFNRGAVPIVLISTYRLTRTREPHWVTVTGFDDDFVYLHDPYVDREHQKSRMDCMQVPVLLDDFEGMMRYGKKRQQAALLLHPRTAG